MVTLRIPVPKQRHRSNAASIAVLIALFIQSIVPRSTVAEPTPISPHHEAWRRHFHQPTQPALIGSGGRPQPLRQRAQRPAQAQRAVFGFLPYWISADYYDAIDFDLLTHIAPFSIEVNPDGSLGEDHDWPWTALVDRAHRHDVRVILTATLFGDADVLALLGDETSRARFMRQISDKVKAGNADGVIIDFEGPGQNGWPDQIAGFLRDLTEYLHAEIPGSEVSFASPAIDWSNRWDFAAIAASCDYLFVMGYAFSGSWSSAAGPTAPLSGSGRTITSLLSEDRDYGQVVREQPEKLILGVPYYGCRWKTRSGEAGAGVDDFVNYPRLRDAMPQAAKAGVRWDERSQTAWYRYQEEAQWLQVWFDDTASLRRKYALAIDRNLRGFGMWALGYEGTHAEPWQLIEELNGRRVPTLVETQSALPATFAVSPLHPNPFNGRIHTSYQMPAAGRVQIELFDALGRSVRSWAQRADRPGHATWSWDGRNTAGRSVASGVYVVRFRFFSEVGALQTQIRRIALLR